MKLHSLFISGLVWLMLFTSHNLFAQCGVSNGDFSQVNCTNCAAFNPITPGTPISNVPNWVATHGTPDDHTWGPSNHVSMGGSEGIRTDYDLIVGHTYTISFQIKVDDSQNQYSNLNPGTTFVRAMNNGPLAIWGAGNWLHTQPSLPAEQELITSIASNAAPYWVENWETVQVQYTPSGSPTAGKYTQLWIYYSDLVTQFPNNTWSSIRNVQITEATPTSSFHIQSNFLTNGTPKTVLNECENVVLNGLASQKENKHYIDVWRKQSNTSNPYVWAGRYNTPNNGWTFTSAGVVDLTFSMGIQFTAGWDYRVKLAVGNNCHGWVESTQDFSMVTGGNAPSPAFHMEKHLVGLPVQDFSGCHEMWLVETGEANNGHNYDKWYLHIRERAINSGQPFAWKGRYTNNNGGWVTGNLPARLDLKTAFDNLGNPLVGGYEYEVLLALRNPCSGWEAVTNTFKVDYCSKSALSQEEVKANSAEERLTVYPNPANNVITPSITDFSSLQVLDMLGREVISQNGEYSEINVSELPKGVYQLRMKLNDGTITNTNFVKE